MKDSTSIPTPKHTLPTPSQVIEEDLNTIVHRLSDLKVEIEERLQPFCFPENKDSVKLNTETIPSKEYPEYPEYFSILRDYITSIRQNIHNIHNIFDNCGL